MPPAIGSTPRMFSATSPSAMPLTSRWCRPQNFAICAKVSVVLSSSQTAVARGIRTSDIGILLNSCLPPEMQPPGTWGAGRVGSRTAGTLKRPIRQMCAGGKGPGGFGPKSRSEKDFPRMPAAGHPGECGLGIGQREGALENRLDPPRDYMRPEIALNRIPDPPLFRQRPGPQRGRQDRKPLHQHRREVHARGKAVLIGNVDDPPINLGGGDVLLDVVAADHVQSHVRSE